VTDEQKILARVGELDETSELAMALEEIHANAGLAGVQREAVRSLEAALTVLGEVVPAYDAGSPDDRHAGGGDYHSDVEFLEALIDAEEQIRDWHHAAVRLYADAGEALGRAHDDLGRARQDLAAAYAMGTERPCNGCHPAKAAAISAAEAAIEDAKHRIGICEHAGEILESLTERLRGALARLCQVPHDLGEAYELIHAYLQGGGEMPKPGRWITGAGA
jgi:hypothetical protein